MATYSISKDDTRAGFYTQKTDISIYSSGDSFLIGQGRSTISIPSDEETVRMFAELLVRMARAKKQNGKG
jgi:hypothetical protein